MLLLAVLVGAGCADPIPPVTSPWGQVEALGTPLVHAGRWMTVDADADPWVDERPAVIECPEYAIEVEPGGLEIDTGDCDYATLQQPALSAIAAGDEVAFIFWHNALTAESEAVAHVALQIGPHLIWEITLPIPGPGGVHIPTMRAHFSAPVGTPVYLHLHNHGANTWLFSTVEVRRAVGTVSGQ